MRAPSRASPTRPAATAWAGAPGHNASAQYVAGKAASAGLDTSFQDFRYDLDFLADFTPPELAVVSGAPAKEYVPGIAGASLGGDFGSMFNSRSTNIPAAPVWAIDLNLDPNAPVNTSTSGCQIRLQRHARRRDRSRSARHVHVRDEAM